MYNKSNHCNINNYERQRKQLSLNLSCHALVRRRQQIRVWRSLNSKHSLFRNLSSIFR